MGETAWQWMTRPGPRAPRAFVAAVYVLTAAQGLALAAGSQAVRTSFEESESKPDEVPEGFEVAQSLPFGWECAPFSPDANGTAVWAPGTAHRGELSMLVTAAYGRYGFAGPRLEAAFGQWVKAAAWVQEWQAPDGVAVGVIWLDSKGKSIRTDLSAPCRDARRWTRVKIECQAPPGAAALRPALVALGPGMAWFDDVSVLVHSAPPVVLSEFVHGPALQGERLTVRFSVEVGEGFDPGETADLELVGVADNASVARATLPVELPQGELTPGAYLLGPFDLQVDPYAPPGDYAVRIRLGDAVLLSTAVADGSVVVEPRPRDAPEGGPLVSTVLWAPMAAAAGERLPVRVMARAEPPPVRPVVAAVSLRQGRVCYAAAEVVLRSSPSGESQHAADLSGEVWLDVPAGCPGGDLLVEAGLTGRLSGAAVCSRPVRVDSGQGAVHTLAHGRYRSSEGTSHSWRTNTSGVLVWDGLPYVPIGAMARTSFLVDYDPEDPEGNKTRWERFLSDTRQLAEAGLRDVYLVTSPRGLADLPTAAVQRVIDRFEELGFRYGVEIGGSGETGYAGYLIGSRQSLSGIAPGVENFLDIRDERAPVGEALVALYEEGGPGAPAEVQRQSLRDGQARIRVEDSDATRGRTYRAYATPQVFVPPAMGPGDLADDGCVRARKRTVCQALERMRFGEGLRFLANPLSTDPGLPPADVIPAFPSTFPIRFAQWLEAEYEGDLTLLTTLWSFVGEERPEDFYAAGRLIPLGGPGPLTYLADPDEARYYPCDLSHSAFEADLEAFRQDIQAESLADIVAAIKSIVDVPIIVEPEAGASPAVARAEGGGPRTALRRPRPTGRHYVTRDASGGPDGVALSPPLGGGEYTDSVMAVRLAENRLRRRLPWMVATRLIAEQDVSATPASVDEALDLARRWGARGAFVQWGFDSTAAPGAPALLDARPALGRLAQLTKDVEAFLETAAPDLVLAYPPRGRFPLTGEDNRPLALSGEMVGGRAVRLSDGRWLAPAATLAHELRASYIVSLPRSNRHRSWARELAGFLTDAPDARLLLLGAREDLGAVPPLDRLLTVDRGPCPFGAGESQLLADGADAEPMGEGCPGHLALLRRGPLLLFPVVGLTDEDALWLLNSLCEPRAGADPETPGPSLAGTAVRFGEESDDGGP